MRFPHTVAAELRKAATLPGTVVAIAVAALGSIVITLLNSNNVHSRLTSGRAAESTYQSAVDVAFGNVPLGTIGAVILGVVAISSEYTANSGDAGGGRQITATLTATTRRWRVLAAKAIAVVLLVAATAAVTIPAMLAVAHAIIGNAAPAPAASPDLLGRTLGAALYWALMALMAMAVTVITRSGVIPLIVFVVNGTVVSVSFLLTKVTSLARYLPDLAGAGLFTRTALYDTLAPVTSGLVTGAWAAGLLVVAAVVFARRDA